MINTEATNAGGEDLYTPRILSPVHPRERWPRQALPGFPIRRVAVLDTECTGLDPLRHSLVEITVAILAVDETGDVAAIEQVRSGLQDPGTPLSEEVKRVTGLSDEVLKGRSIDPQSIAGALEGVQTIIAFNASFDRPFLERFAPVVSPHRWACALKDLDWRGLGYEPGAQNWILAQLGYFNPVRHRALADVQSLVTILAHKHSEGESLMAKLLRAADRPAWRFEARQAPYRFKDDLKDWRYSWSPRHRVWHKHIRDTEFRAEYRRYREVIGQRPAVVPLPAQERYRGDWQWRPA